METTANNEKKANLVLTGSICLSDIPKELIKKVETKQIGSDGKPVTKLFLNIAVMETAEPSKFGHTHFISCAPKKEERVEGRSYIIGNFKRWIPKTDPVTQEQINNAPTLTPEEVAALEQTQDLPF